MRSASARKMDAGDNARPGNLQGRLSHLDYKYKSNCLKSKLARYARRSYGPDDKWHEYVRLCCKTWSCAYCGKNIKLPQLRKRMQSEVLEHRLMLFTTLTVPRSRRNIQHEMKNMSKSYRKLVETYKRKQGGKLSYIWVKETAGMENAHIHAFLPEDVDKKTIRKWWHKYTGAHQIDFRPMSDADVAGCVEYATKEIVRNACRYHRTCGRWSGCSRDIVLSTDRHAEEEPGWEMVERTVPEGAIPTRRTDDGTLLRFLTCEGSPCEARERASALQKSRLARPEGNEQAKPARSNAGRAYAATMHCYNAPRGAEKGSAGMQALSARCRGGIENKCENRREYHECILGR